MNTRSKGFTLIELLVVIAIIGILAALVLVALGNARDKANDARIKSDVGQLRTISEIIYDSLNANYENTGATAGVEQCVGGASATTCTSLEISNNVTALVTDINDANGGAGNPTAESTATGFCIEAQLNDGTFTCVDNTGVTETGHSPARCTAVGDVSCAS